MKPTQAHLSPSPTFFRSSFLPYNDQTKAISQQAEEAAKMLAKGNTTWEPEECAGVLEGLMRGRKGGGRVLDLGELVFRFDSLSRWRRSVREKLILLGLSLGRLWHCEGLWCLAWAAQFPYAQKIVGMDVSLTTRAVFVSLFLSLPSLEDERHFFKNLLSSTDFLPSSILHTPDRSRRPQRRVSFASPFVSSMSHSFRPNASTD